MQRWATKIPAFAVATLVLAHAAIADTIWPQPTNPPQINVTTDSTRGWLPTDRQIAEVRRTTDDFLSAKDSGRSADAFALLADITQRQQSFAEYASAIAKFNQQAGAVRERRIVTVTWTKDPAQSPAPGVYAAIDLVSLYANIDRHCGYLILYQAPSGGPFRVMREESDFIDNATAQTIENQHSRAELDKTWAQLSANCPNYPAELAPLPEQPVSTIGYPTVAAALQALRANPRVKFSTQNGWTVAYDDTNYTAWSFAPPGDPAYPAVAKRQFVPDGKGTALTMSILCEATKMACDNFVRQFETLNAQMKAALK